MNTINSSSQAHGASANGTARALSSEPGTSRGWWFLGTLAVLRNPDDAPRAPTVIELTIPPGGSPPRHIHGSLDDSFYLLDGELVVCCGGRTTLAVAGSYVVLPAGVEHTFRVTSAGAARMLLVHAEDDFLRFIEAVGTPTRDLRLPTPGEHDLDRDVLIRISAEHDIRITGAPLQPGDASELRQRTVEA